MTRRHADRSADEPVEGAGADADEAGADADDAGADAGAGAEGSGEAGLPPVPAALLAPLLQWTGEALRELKAQEVPAALRPMLSFDRRGFGNAAARAQLHRALTTDAAFRERIFEAMAGRPEVVAALKEWDAGRAVDLAEDAAARDDLDLFASALVLARPDSWELGVGVALTVFERTRAAGLVEDDRHAFETQVRKAQEAQRRAEAEGAKLGDEVQRLTEELREERASRRDREEVLRGEAGEAAQRVAELEAGLAQAQAELGRMEERAGKEEQRAREASARAEGLEVQVSEARAEAARARADAERNTRGSDRGSSPEAIAGSAPASAAQDGGPIAPPALSSDDIDLLARAGEIARRLAEASVDPPSPTLPAVPESLEDAGSREAAAGMGGATGATGASGGARRGKRAPVALAPGLVGPSVAGLRSAMTSGDVSVIVDGYNVSMQAWGDDPLDAQRQRLCALLERLHLRTNRSVTVVFDGADVEGVRPPRRPGVRVVFSDAGEEADDVVIREVRALPLDRPVIVVSTDRAVRTHAEEAGAMSVPSDVFLEFLRK